MPISIVTPIYNRRHNLGLFLTALYAQTDRRFELVLADDGSDDNPLAVLATWAGKLEVTYCWQPHAGFRAGQARNMGVKLAKNSHILFVDSDVLLNPCAIAHYHNLIEANPTPIIIGRYDWLPPMQITPDDVQHRWQDLVDCKLPRIQTATHPGMDAGVDIRAKCSPSRFADKRIWTTDYCLVMLSGNLLFPRSMFLELGGFDEQMVGHGGEDCELAMRAQERNLPVIFADEVIGYHVFHERNQARNLEEVERNIAYIRSKHDLAALGVEHGTPTDLPLVAKEKHDS